MVPRPYWEKVDGILKKKLVWSNTNIKNSMHDPKTLRKLLNICISSMTHT